MNEPRIDWAKIINDLVGMGVSPVAVAKRLGIARSTPYRWIEGSEPLYSHGAGLILLHAEICGVRHSETEVAHPPARKHLENQGENDEREPSNRTRKASGWR